MLYAIHNLGPQHVKVDLIGIIYHDSIPPITRKKMGAFYTNPIAAELLATLAIKKWQVQVLDPACGSGTLLVASYKRKKELYVSQTQNMFSSLNHTTLSVLKVASNRGVSYLLNQPVYGQI